MNKEIEILISDIALRTLMKHHFDNLRDLDLNLAHNVKELQPNDDFSVSQYLLGINYYRKRLEKIFPRGERFLDVGCGAGNWAIAAQYLFTDVIGVDIHAERIKMAQAISKDIFGAPNVRFFNTTVEDLNLPDQSVNSCLCYNVLSVLSSSQKSFLKSIRKIIKNDGTFYVTATGTGFLLYLFVQLIKNPTANKIKAFSLMLYRNILYLVQLRRQPASWVSNSHMMRIARETGWEIVNRGYEGTISPEIMPLFPKTYAGLPFMNEYILIPRK